MIESPRPTAPGDGSADSAATVGARLRDQGVETVIVTGADTFGMMRGKRLPIAQFERALEHGMLLCDVFWVMHIDESDLVARPENHVGYFPTEKHGYPDILAVPDVNTLRLVPWHERTALVLADFTLQDGRPVPIAPRTVLKRVVERARAMGYEPYCGVELEFFLLRETFTSLLSRHASDLVPYHDRPATYGVVTGSAQEPIARLIRQGMLEYGLPIEACNLENGPGQFEINLRYADAVTAADAAFLFKSGVKEIAAQNGLVATFMAKPRPDWSGNSCHLHLSLTGGDGRNAFYDGDRDDGISETMRHFIGGILATMREFTALLAPTINSYRRYVPYSWAGTTASWGIDNRSAGIRAVCEGSHGTRVEHRQAGGDVNPYLGAAAALAAGLCGIENRIEPGEAVKTDVYALPAGAVPVLPRSLDEATNLLAASETARAWLGDDFVSYYVELKRAEVEAYARAVTDWEIARYAEAL
jgi:glutamine synthetase